MSKAEEHMDEEEMLQRCSANDAVAQRYLYERYKRVMTGVCMRYADRYEEAQDIVQNGFIKVFKKLDSFSGKGSLEGWIRRIMVNTALDHLRSNKAERFNVNIDDVDYKLQKDELILDALQAQDLLELIQTLPVGYRTVFNLYAIEGYAHKEIAEELDISENTSKSQYSRARALLMKKIAEIER